ncbi:MAG TPA: T9SS type A sorting domain-containing protein [Candidatus Eisenbacteria bacterium]|nr:T9SS type A sorting domain-containing protein [Candidatus Eisenbacteria bacterium]
MRCASSTSGSGARAGTARLLAALALAGLALAAAGTTAVTAEARTGAWDPASIAAAVRAVDVPWGLRVLDADGSAPVRDVSERVRALTRAGFHVEVVVAPHTYFVRAEGSAALPPGFAERTPAAAAPSAPDDPVDPFGAAGDVLPPRSPRSSTEARRETRARALPAGTLDGLPYGAGWESTSELMVGSVAVPILFPESDGTVDPDRFDWTPALRDSIVRSAVRGLLRWTSLASARGVPLTFVIEVHPPSPTRFEPIDRPVAQEFGWIEDTLEPIVGYQGDAALMAYEVANAARARLGTQWAALIFGVQNDTDADGAFPDGFIAHAQLGGPWFVVPVNNLNTQASLDFYMQHEMAHMFWALDEFPANNAWWSCSYHTGYFNQPNWNSAVPVPRYCGWDDRCVMKGNYPDSLCTLTERQVGWVNENGNSILDLYETRPAVRPDSTLYRVASGGTMLVRGAAADVAHPNRNPFLFGEGDSITIATIDSVWYRMDGGPWISVGAEDGAMDEGSERFAISLTAPPVGMHRMEFLAKNSSGFTGVAPDTLPVSVSGGAFHVPSDGASVRGISVRPNPAAGKIRLSLRTAPSARVEVRMYDVSGRLIQTWHLHTGDSGALEWEWDGQSTSAPVPSGVYYVTARTRDGMLTARCVWLRQAK